MYSLPSYEHRFFIDLNMWVDRLAYSPDGCVLASADRNENIIHLWDAQTGEKIRTLGRVEGEISSLTYASDGRVLASNGADNIICLWGKR